MAWLAGTVACCHAPTLLAQSATVTIEAASDERRRGLSWSDGAPIVKGAISVPVTPDFTLDAAATTLWGDGRFDADAVVDIGAKRVWNMRGWRVAAEGIYHFLPGISGAGYGEAGAIADFTLGPATVEFAARYAPRQSAIGGDNLYLSTSAATAIPGTPLTLSGHVGRSSGKVRDATRAVRLRPDGRYWDHGVAIDWYKGRWTVGLRYANSDADGPNGRHAGATIIARAGVTF